MSPPTAPTHYDRFFYWKWMDDTDKPLLLWYVQANGGDVRYEKRIDEDDEEYHIFTDAEDHIEYGLQGELLALVNRIHGFPLTFRLALKQILCPDCGIGLMDDACIVRKNLVKETRVLYPLTERNVRTYVDYIGKCWATHKNPTVKEWYDLFSFSNTWIAMPVKPDLLMKDFDLDKELLLLYRFASG